MHIQMDLSQAALQASAAPPKEMLSVRRDSVSGKYDVKINYSSLAIILTCMRKSELSLKLLYKNKAENPATCFGSAIHKALEIFYREPRANRKLPPKFAQEADLLLASDLVNVPDHFLYRALAEFLRAAEPLRILPESDKRSLSAGLWSLRHYFETYIDDPFVVVEDAKGPIAERTCEAVLYDSPELRITYFGTIDVVLRNEKTGVILPTDHKTFSSAPGDFFKRIKPNHQYTGYIWLTRECLGLDVDTFMANGIQVKPRPVTSRGTPPHFPRQPTRRTAEDIEDFKKTVIWATRQYVASLESGIWPMGDVNACAMYNGCNFQKVCEVPKIIQQNVLNVDYNQGVPTCQA